MPVHQAGGIVFRRERDGISILLVRAKKDPSIWIFPKGHIEKGETPQQTAVRETREEAGVDGRLVGGRVGEPIEFHNGKERVRVEYFLIEARSESDDTDGREKRWFAIDDAIAAVAFDTAQRLLRDARSRLSSPPPRSR
jgi:8-oxo-dGTP pyrophosphatase MutT (NUDIX family)